MHNHSDDPPSASELPNLKTFLVCGMTGAGKSTFIQKVTGAQISVSGGIDSDTVDVIEVGIPLVPVGNECIQLVDTPGFGDSREQSETVILRRITTWLVARYMSKVPVTGLIFLRPMHDVRVNRLEKALIAMFKDLCGQECLDHIFLVTTRWTSRMTETHKQCEWDILTRKELFGSDGSKQVQVRRLDDDYSAETAQRLVYSCAGLSPVTFQIQREIVDEEKTLGQTEAGMRIGADLDEKIAGLEAKAQKASEYAAAAMKKLEEAERAKRKLEEERARAAKAAKEAEEAAKKAQREAEAAKAREEQARKESEERARKAEAEAKAAREQAAKAQKEAEERAKRAEAELKAARDRSEQERKEAEERARRAEADAKAAREQSERVQKEAKERARRDEADDKAARDRAERDRWEAETRALKAELENKAAQSAREAAQTKLELENKFLELQAQKYQAQVEQAARREAETQATINDLKSQAHDLSRPVEKGFWAKVGEGFAKLFWG